MVNMEFLHKLYLASNGGLQRAEFEYSPYPMERKFQKSIVRKLETEYITIIDYYENGFLFKMTGYGCQILELV